MNDLQPGLPEHILCLQPLANITAYADNSVTGNNQYCYRIRAINISGNSGYNGPQCATTPAEGANGLDLGASSAYVTYGASPGLASQEFTIELWFKRTGTELPNQPEQTESLSCHY
ncbi:MAG: hypothetical protein IPP93_16145 [Chitinophagaceae bacterium]|nr:hypothetical protein [Chitinophagaceae bacterium]